MPEPKHVFPPDVRNALGLTAAALGLTNLAAIAVCFYLAVHEKPIPAIVGFIVGRTLDNLGDLGQWVLDFNAKRRGRKGPER